MTVSVENYDFKIINVVVGAGKIDGNNPIGLLNAAKNRSGAKPLYIVDGVVVSSIDDIGKDEIDCFSILKDEAAVQVYGEKGENGVVIITKK